MSEYPNPPSGSTPAYIGRLWRVADGIAGELSDRLGHTIRFVGVRDTARGGYVLRSVAIEVAPYAAIPGLDDGA